MICHGVYAWIYTKKNILEQVKTKYSINAYPYLIRKSNMATSKQLWDDRTVILRPLHKKRKMNIFLRLYNEVVICILQENSSIMLFVAQS